MKILIQNARVINPAGDFDEKSDLAIADGRIIAIQKIVSDFTPNLTLDASGCVAAPGWIDLCARLGEPGHEHDGLLQNELAAAAAGGVTSLVCPPDTNPVLDEPGLVNMLKFRAEKLGGPRLFPLGALTRALQGNTLTEMVQLTQAGCVGFSQADVPLGNTQVLLRALQYASSFNLTVWLRPQELHLSQGVAASGEIATRLGLSGVPVAAETIALHTIFELVRATSARVHLCRISSAAGVELLAQAKSQGLPVSADVSINSLHLTDTDIGHFDSRMRLNPPLRQQRDRDALRQGLVDGTLDALVSDHTPVEKDAKDLPFSQAQAGATGVELLLSLACQWGQGSHLDLKRTLRVLTSGPAAVLDAQANAQQNGLGQLVVGGVADVCIFDPAAHWTVQDAQLRSRSKQTPFSGHELPACVRHTLVAGELVYSG